MTEREALRMVAQAIEEGWSFDRIDTEVYGAIQEALAQPEQEPVAWMYPDALCDRSCLYLCTKGFTQFPECATPPQRKPLTDEQIAHATAPVFMGGEPSLTGIARAIEAAHGIKGDA